MAAQPVQDGVAVDHDGGAGQEGRLDGVEGVGGRREEGRESRRCWVMSSCWASHRWDLTYCLRLSAMRLTPRSELNTLVAPPSHSTKLMLPLSSTRH